jgi:hypothetical protein
MHRRRLALLAIAASAGILSTASNALAAMMPNVDSNVAQANDKVLAIARVGGVVYIGGDFTSLTDSGGAHVRNHLAAIDAATGQVINWDPNVSGPVRSLAVSVDGSQIYVGGAFATAGGLVRSNLAAYAATTTAGGAATPLSWAPKANGTVFAVAPIGQRVLIGGSFTAVSGARRVRLAAVAATTGAVLPWSPKPNAEVRAILPSPNGSRIIVAGFFTLINGTADAHIAALSPSGSNGTPLPWASHPGYAIKALAGNASSVFGGGAGGGGHLPAYNVATGALRYTKLFDGNVEGVALVGGQLIAGGHFNHAGLSSSATVRHHLAAFDPVTGAIDTVWHPNVNQPLGIFMIYGRGQKLYIGGDFTSVGTTAVTSFASFSTASGPGGPAEPADTTPPTITRVPDAHIGAGATLGTTTVPVAVTWAATDPSPASGICRSLLERNANGGAFTPVGLLLPTLRTAPLSLLPGSTAHDYRVTVADCSDNATAATAGPAVHLHAFQKPTSGITYAGTWTPRRLPKAFGGTVRQAGHAGASAKLSFTGREVAWVASKTAAYGSAKVYIDGALAATVNLHSPLTIRRRVVFTHSWASNGAHTIRIVAVGTAGHPLIDVDALLTIN